MTTPRQAPPAPPPASARPAADWRATLPLDELEPGALVTFKGTGEPLVLGRTASGEPFALAGRCPHEGYPLAQGTLRGEALTCCWHNWKFDVRSGACLLGGEDVRRFGTRVVDGVLEVDVAEPDPAESFPTWLASLETAMHERDLGRAIRDGVRLLEGGYDAAELLLRVAAFDARHAEYGTTHALPVAADGARFLERYAGVQAMYAIAPAIDMCSEANQRLPERPVPAPIEGASAEALRTAVEAEDAVRAEGLLRGAFEAGVPRREIDAWMFGVLADHFLDFGHPLIYLVKAQELVELVGDDAARELYPALLFGIVLGTREDTLPYMAPYSRRLAELEPRLAEAHARRDPDAAFDAEALIRATLDGRAEEAFAALEQACLAGVPAERLSRALVVAAARRVLRFDVSIDADPGVAENWLWATHRFTFASAVRNTVERFDDPGALRFLFQCLAFVHSGHRMDAPPERRSVPRPVASSVEEVVAAIARRDATRAVDGALGLLRADDPRAAEELRTALEDLCLADPLVRPIAVAHAIKTTVAAFEERAALEGCEGRDDPVLAAVRFLASPFEERRVHATVGTSIRWVHEGVLPRKLTQ